jgi:PAS domain S-box-containing protein
MADDSDLDSPKALRARIAVLEQELARARLGGEWTAEAALVHDADGRILEANDRAQRLLGYDLAELRARDMFAIEASLAETDPAATRDSWKLLEPGVPTVARGRFVRKDGARLPVEVTVVARDDAGARRLLLVARDITDRVRVERALRDSEQRFRFLFEAAPVAMLRAGEGGELLHVNRALCGWLGRSALALAGTPARDLVEPGDRPALDDMFEVLRCAPGAPVRGQLRCLAADGRTPWGQLTLSAEVGPGRLKQVIGVLEDIDGRKRAEAQVAELLTSLEGQVESRTAELRRTNLHLRREVVERERAEALLVRARERAEAANGAKNRFLQVMSHELRTPLNAILGYAEMHLDCLDDGEPPEPEQLHDDLRRIRASGEHLLALIDDILHFSRLEAGPATLERSRVEVAPFLRDLAGTIRAQLARTDLEFTIDVPDDAGAIETDAPKLRHVVRHLLRNAAKFTHRGRVELRAARRADWLHIDVCDTGIGIRPEHIGRLFAPFVQLDDSPTRRYGGMGLGLALCRRYCDELGGSISVESAVGRGSRFALRLPLAPPARA